MNYVAVILLQIVMVSPGTHLKKDNLSPSPEPLSPSSKTNDLESTFAA